MAVKKVKNLAKNDAICNSRLTENSLVEKKSNFNLNTFLLVLVVILLIGISFFVGALWQKVALIQTQTQTAVTPNTVQPPVVQQRQPISQDQIKNIFSQKVIKFGDDTRKILIVEFADPSCPYCHVAGGLDPELNNQIGANFKLSTQGGPYIAPVPEIRKLIDSGQASYAYIYFPGHQNGELTMKAMYCADEQGKFWEAHDKLMTNAGYKLINDQVRNDITKTPVVVKFLSGSVDSNKLSECIKSGRNDSRLASDTALGRSFNVDGTPNFYVNTTVFPGAVNYSSIKPTVDKLLE